MNHLIHLGLTVLSYVYFNVVHVVFTVINYIYPRRIVPRPTNRILLLSATKLAEKIRNGELTSFEVINAYIARVEEVNPIINAMVYPNFDNARKEAKAVDHYLSNLDKDSDEFKNLAKTKPILGVPFTLKDIIKVKGMNCSMGVPARANYIADEDAAYVKQLKDAGGIVLGTTNVPELAMWLETNNHLHGMTNNPYDSRRIPGGSSGGEGALIAAAGSVIGIGSDIGGSIRMPSFFSGIFGFKNTQFLIDRTGHEPEGLTAGGLRNEMFVVGPMCRYIEDIPLMMKIGNPEKCEKFKLDDPIDLSKVRLYYMEGIKSLVMEPLHCDILAKLHEAITYLETECRMTSVKVDFPEMKSGFGFWVTDLESKECPSFAKLATDFHGEANFVAEFGKCLIGRSDHTMAVIIGGLIEHFGGIHSDDRKKELRRIHEKMRTELHALLEKNAVLLFPGFSYPAPYHHQALWSGCNIAYTSIFNSMGLPSLAVPTGLNKDGLPTGVQIVGAPNNDALLLAVGRKLDKGFGGWTAPGLSVQ